MHHADPIDQADVVTLYCPTWVAVFPQTSKSEFKEQYLDAIEPEVFLSEARTNGPLAYLPAFRQDMLAELPVEQPIAHGLTDISQQVKQIQINLEAHAGQIWLRLRCLLDAQTDWDSLDRLKEYIAECITCNQDVLSQYAVVEQDGAVAVITFEAVDCFSPTCQGIAVDGLALSGNHLLTEEELRQTANLPLKQQAPHLPGGPTRCAARKSPSRNRDNGCR